MNKKFYLTSAIAYASKKPHIGNTYEIVLCDAIARYHRQLGFDVFFLTGTDEHGQKIEELAKADGINEQKYVDNVAQSIREIWDTMNSSYDKFIRTTDDYHKSAVQKIFKQLYDQGDIYKGEYSGLYCVPDESFWTEAQLVDGKCPDCGREVVETKEEAYFFKMSKYQDWLIKYIDENPEFIQPESRKNEMINTFLKPGLQDLCVSRTSFKWGIPVEFDPGHVIYVWIDALSNYITALGFKQDDDELYQRYWCDTSTENTRLHIIGKDILRFHTIYWPIMLKALEIPLPTHIFGHPWLLSGGDKMSKSIGNVMYADDLIKHFGLDAVRYYVLREMPYANDGTITYENIITRYNADLANTLGNLVNRTISMINKYFGGEIPSGDFDGDFDKDLKSTCAASSAKVAELMQQFRVADALAEIWVIVDRANKYIDETTPWILAKDEVLKPRLGTVMFNLIEAIRAIAEQLQSFMPDTANSIQEQIGSGGSKVTETPTPLFARIDMEEKLKEIEG